MIKNPCDPRMKITTTADTLPHKIDLELASGARLTLLFFSDREARWIFSYDYVGTKTEPGATPGLVGKIRLTADYAAGILCPRFELSMHVIVPSRLGREFYLGVDISPGAKTYLEFIYEREEDAPVSYGLVEICKGARDRVRLDHGTSALARPIQFPFPIPDRVSIEHGKLHVPFLTNADHVHYFDLPQTTVR